MTNVHLPGKNINCVTLIDIQPVHVWKFDMLVREEEVELFRINHESIWKVRADKVQTSHINEESISICPLDIIAQGPVLCKCLNLSALCLQDAPIFCKRT